jgi:rubredoxin
MDRYICLRCGFIYDPRKGDPAGGLAPGTELAQAGPDWRCPRCGAAECDFARKEEDG